MLGVVVFVIAIWATVCVIVSGRSGGGPIGVGLVCYGFLFVVSITFGRVRLGVANSTCDEVFTITVWAAPTSRCWRLRSDGDRRPDRAWLGSIPSPEWAGSRTRGLG